MSSRHALGWSEAYPVGADGERDNVTVMFDILRAMGEGEDVYDWARDRSATDRRYAIEWYHTNENRYRSAKEATGAKYARRGQ